MTAAGLAWNAIPDAGCNTPGAENATACQWATSSGLTALGIGCNLL